MHLVIWCLTGLSHYSCWFWLPSLLQNKMAAMPAPPLQPPSWGLPGHGGSLSGLDAGQKALPASIPCSAVDRVCPGADLLGKWSSPFFSWGTCDIVCRPAALPSRRALWGSGMHLVHPRNKSFTTPWAPGFKLSLWEDFGKEERIAFFLTAANEKSFHLGVAGHIYGNVESTCNIYSGYRSDWIYLLLIRIYMPTKILLRSIWENFI